MKTPAFSPLTVYSHKNSFNAFVLRWSTCNTRAATGSLSVLSFVSYNLHSRLRLKPRYVTFSKGIWYPGQFSASPTRDLRTRLTPKASYKLLSLFLP